MYVPDKPVSSTPRTILTGSSLQEDGENSLISLFFVFCLSAEKPEYTNIKLAVFTVSEHFLLQRESTQKQALVHFFCVKTRRKFEIKKKSSERTIILNSPESHTPSNRPWVVALRNHLPHVTDHCPVHVYASSAEVWKFVCSCDHMIAQHVWSPGENIWLRKHMSPTCLSMRI